MAISEELRDRMAGITAELRQGLWGAKGYPRVGNEVRRDRGADGGSRRCHCVCVALRGAARAGRGGGTRRGQVWRLRGADPLGRNRRTASPSQTGRGRLARIVRTMQALPEGFFSLTPRLWESRRMTRSVPLCSAKWSMPAVMPAASSRPAGTCKKKQSWRFPSSG